MEEKVLLSDIIETAKKALYTVFEQYTLVLKITLITTLLSVGYFLMQSPNYKATATFILEEKSSSKSGIGALASQIGFDISSLTASGAGLFDGDNILDIMESRLIVEKVLLSQVDSTSKNNRRTLADIFVDQYKLKKKWKDDEYLSTINFSNAPTKEAELIKRDSALYTIYEKITKNHLTVSRQNKKGSIIVVEVLSKDQSFSKLFTERLIKETGNLYIEIKTSNTNNNIARLEKKADSLHTKLYNKSLEAVSLLNANTAIKTTVVSEDLSQKDKTAAFTLYGEVLKNLEALKLSQINQTPVIQILDSPKYPLVNQAVPWFLIIGAGIGIGIVLSVLVIFYLYTGKR
mgnify:FL=1